MFVKANATPATERARINWFVVSDITIRAAMKETEEIAFVNDMSGVCNSLETWRINSMPRKVESMKMMRLIGRSARTWLAKFLSFYHLIR